MSKENARGTRVEYSQTAPAVRLGTSCVSTSAEMAAHLTTVRGDKIVAINDRLTESPQTVQAPSARDRA